MRSIEHTNHHVHENHRVLENRSMQLKFPVCGLDLCRHLGMWHEDIQLVAVIRNKLFKIIFELIMNMIVRSESVSNYLIWMHLNAQRFLDTQNLKQKWQTLESPYGRFI